MLPTENGLVVALADGAGGLGNGGRAAQAWIDTVIGSPSPPTWAGLLEKIDESTARRGPGQTTAIALSIAEDITGVCVGDSAIWLVTGIEVIDLAEHVPPKPLVGDGCMVYEIAAPFARGTLLVATDGLVKYVPRDRIAAIARGDLDTAAKDLIELVRLPTGSLHDDTTVVLCRR